LLCSVAAARESSTTDRAIQLLTAHGLVPVHAAGPYVERGTPRVQVAAKLGRPDAILPDGTWLYHDRAIEGSEATGTLLVRFEHKRVSSLALAGPSTVAALQAKNPDRLAMRPLDRR
jgi:hypothetical protein